MSFGVFGHADFLNMPVFDSSLPIVLVVSFDICWYFLKDRKKCGYSKKDRLGIGGIDVTSSNSLLCIN